MRLVMGLETDWCPPRRVRLHGILSPGSSRVRRV